MLNRDRWVRVLACVICLALASRAAGDAQGAGAVPDGDVRRNVEMLASADFRERERGQRALLAIGAPAEAGLREAAGALPVAEARQRASLVLNMVRLGIRPDTPESVYAQARAYRAAGGADERVAVATEMLNGRGAEHAGPVVVRLWADEADPDVRRRVAELFRSRAYHVIPSLLAAGHVDEAGSVLEQAARAAERGNDVVERRVVFLLLTGRLDAALAATGPDALPEAQRGAALLAAGRPREALAWSAGRPEAEVEFLRSTAHWMLGDMDAVASEFVARARDAEEPDFESLAIAVGLYRIGGNEAEMERALRALRAGLDHPAGERSAAGYNVGENLMLCGRVEEGMEVFRRHARSTAVELLVAQLRYDEALALLAEEPKGDAEQAGYSSAAARDFHRKLSAARIYLKLGRKPEASALLDEAVPLARELARADGERRSNWWAMGQVARLEWDLGRREAAERRAVSSADEAGTGRLVGELFEGREQEARAWWAATRAADPSRDPLATLADVRAALAGRLPAGSLDAAAAAAVRAADEAATEAAAARARRSPRHQGSALEPLLPALLRAGRRDTAVRVAESALIDDERVAAEPWLAIGDADAAAGRWAEAAGCYARARAARPTDAAPAYLHGWALSKSGDPDGEATRTGLEQMKLARLMPLDDEGARGELASALAQRGLTGEAAREHELILRLYSFWANSHGAAALALADAAAARGEYGRAANLLDRSMMDVHRMEGALLEATPYFSVPQLTRDWRARGKLAAGDVDGAVALVRASAGMLPDDTEWTIGWVADLEARGRRADADALFEANLEPLRAVGERHPDAVGHLNALAWLCARTGREPDLALASAERAAALEPANAAVLDTLAEVHFRRGDAARAVGLSKRCVELAPDVPVFREQLKRFEAGAASAAP